MRHTDLIHTCTNPACLKEEGTEAQTEERDRKQARPTRLE